MDISFPLMQGIANTSAAAIACGLIWSITLGIIAGSYSCSLIYRLPRNKPLLEDKPYCGACGTALKTPDLFPVFSALLLRFKCRYCGTPFPKSHFWTEILGGLLFCACYLQFNFSETYLLVATIGVLLLVLTFIEVNNRVILMQVLVPLSVAGMIYHTLKDHELYNFFYGGFLALMLGAVAWRKQIKPVNHVFSLPPYHRAVIAAGIVVGLKDIPLALALWAAFFVVFRIGAWATKRRFTFTAPLSLAIMTLLLAKS